MSWVRKWSRDQNVIFKIINCLFLALKLQGECWKDDVVTFTEHLSVAFKRLIKYKQNVVLAAMLEGKSMPSNMAVNANHTILLKNQSAIKYLLNAFPLKFRVYKFRVYLLILALNNYIYNTTRKHFNNRH